MEHEILLWALGILGTLLVGSSGLNAFQWITLNSYKRMKSAEAYQAEINSLRAIIETNQAEIGRLSQRIELADRRDLENSQKYNDLYNRWDKLRDEFETYKLTHK